MQQSLANLDKDLISRGFFGQLPGAALAGSRAAEVERAKAAAIASLGGQMQTQSQEQALAQQRMAAEWALNQSNLWNQMQQQKIQGLRTAWLAARLRKPLEHVWVAGLRPKHRWN